MLQQSYLLTKKKQINTTKCWWVRYACRSPAFSTKRQKILNCMQISRLNCFCKQKMVNGECSVGELHVQEICTCPAPPFGHLGLGIKFETRNPNRIRTKTPDPYPIRNVKNTSMDLIGCYKTYPNPKCY